MFALNLKLVQNKEVCKMENFDDFDCDGDDFSDDFGDYDSDGDFYDDGLNEETQEDSEQEDNGIDIGWEEIAMAGSLSE
jgi:hypothetical protein